MIMATDQEILATEAKLKRFIADLNCLCEKHGVIIDRELPPYQLDVYAKGEGSHIGKIEYDRSKNKYQEHLSQTQKEIRKEVKEEKVAQNEEELKDLLNEVENLQEEFLETVVGKNPKLVSEEEELIYSVALNVIDDIYDDGDLWFNVRYHPEEYTWKKIKDFHWEVIDEGEVIIKVNKTDVCRYVDDEVLDQHYSEYL